MNKKILSIFALIMAISILGVSCAKDNNTTNPTTTPTTAPIDKTEAEKVVQAIAALTESTSSASFDFSQATVTASGADYKVSVTDTAANKNAEIKDLIAAIKLKKGDMEGAGNKLITVDDANISFVIAQDERTVAVTIPYSLKSESKKKANFIITFDLNANHMFKLTDVAKADIEGVFSALGKIDSEGTALTTQDYVDFASSTITTGTIEKQTKDVTETGNNKVKNTIISHVATKIGEMTLDGVTSFVVSGVPEPLPTDNQAVELTVTITLDKTHTFNADVAGANVTVNGGVATLKVKLTLEASKNWDNAGE